MRPTFLNKLFVQYLFLYLRNTYMFVCMYICCLSLFVCLSSIIFLSPVQALHICQSLTNMYYIESIKVYSIWIFKTMIYLRVICFKLLPAGHSINMELNSVHLI